jgi:hypothetical protein
MVTQVQQEQLGLLGLLVQLECKALKDLLAQQVQPGCKALKDFKDHEDFKVTQVQPGCKVFKDRPEEMVPLVQPALKEQLDLKEPLSLDPRDRLDLPEVEEENQLIQACSSLKKT